MSKKSVNTSLILVGLGLLFLVSLSIRTISTPTLWTHLAQGRSSESISFIENASTINTTVLYDKLLYTAYNAGGAPLLIILNAAGLLASFILLLQVGKRWGGAISQSFALLITGHLLLQGFDVGPQTCMMLFIALFVYILSSFKQSAVLFGALIPLQILWTNIHGSFLYGPLIALLATIQVSQNEKGSSRKKQQAKRTGLYAILTGALLVATLANPYLFKMHLQVIQNIAMPYPNYWASLFTDFFQPSHHTTLIFFTLILGAGGLITLKKRLPVMLTTLAIIGAFFAMRSPQAYPLFTALAFPFMVLSFTSVGESLTGTLKPILNKKETLLTPAIQIIVGILFILSIIPVVTNCAYTQMGSASSFGLGAEERLYPADAELILEHPNFPERALNMAADGGYLAWKYNRKVFIDMRPGSYPKDMVRDFQMMMYGAKEEHDRIYEQVRPEAIIINTLDPSVGEGGLTRLLLRPIWRLAYFDGTTAILLLNKEEFAPIFTDPAIQQAGLKKLATAQKAYQEALDKPCQAGNPAELIGAGRVYLSLNRPASSKPIFELILKGNNRIPGAWIGLGNSQLLLKESKEAVQSLKRATELAPNSYVAWASYANACKYTKDKAAFTKAVERAKRIAQSNKRKAKEPKEEKKEEEEIKPQQEPSLPDMAVPTKI